MKKLLQKGYSIIELMIALLLGSILLLGVTQVMISSSTLGTTTNNLLINQDIARSTLDLLGGEARRAGYSGCMKITDGLLAVTGNDAMRYPVVPFLEDNNLGVKFRYGVDEKIGGKRDDDVKLTSQDCLGKDLYYREMIYKNCTKDNKKGICITGGGKEGTTNIANTFIENATLSRIDFTILNVASGKYKTVSVTETSTGSINLPDIQASQSVTFYIDVIGLETEGLKGSSSNQVDRKYSGTYTLRNL